jgi:hypothetical protein
MYYPFLHRLRKRSAAFWGSLLFLFLLALVPRVCYPVMRPLIWYNQSVIFWKALLEGNWGGTYRFSHPGVTVMWVAGLGLQIYAIIHGLSGDELFRPPLDSSGLRHYPVEAGVAALALVIATCIVIAYILLTRLTSWPVAFCSGCLLALDPFFLAFSKVILVDASLASFMLVSVLFLFCHLRFRKWSDLLCSGIFAGLAFLTKSPSAFLLPYTFLVVVLSSFSQVWSAGRGAAGGLEKGRRWARLLWQVVRLLGVWGIVAGFISILLWPAMWVAPFETVSKMVWQTISFAGTPHHDLYLAGQVVDDPGWLFYAATVAWKTTLITLPAVCAAVFFLLRHWREGGSNRYMWWLSIYAAGFFLMMAIGAKKSRQYIMPVFLALDVLAAWGLIQIAKVVRRCKRFRMPGRVSGVIVAVALVVQAGLVLRHHPYYDVHHNLLLGGLPVAQHILPLGDQGEGLDLAARFLNGYPGAERRTAGLQKRFVESFQRDFVGRTRRIGESDVDYWVFAVNVNQRRLNPEQWEGAWEACQRTGFLWSVSFDSVPYAWICPAYPSDPEMFVIDHRLDVQLGDHIDLVGYALSSPQLSAGDTLTVTLFWQSDGRVVADHHVFVHLLDVDGQMAAQHDGVPVQGERPTWDWRDREVLQDDHQLVIAGDLPPGTYTLSAGMYDFSTTARLPAVGPDGERLDDDRIFLGQMIIQP